MKSGTVAHILNPHSTSDETSKTALCINICTVYDMMLYFCSVIANITRNKESTLPVKALVKSLYSVINVLF